MSNKRICSKISIDLPDQLLKKSTVNLIHKMITANKPPSIMKLLKRNRIPRKCMKLSLVKGFRTRKGRRSPLSKGICIYNEIPPFLKSLPVLQMKRKLKKLRIDEIPDD